MGEGKRFYGVMGQVWERVISNSIMDLGNSNPSLGLCHPIQISLRSSQSCELCVHQGLRLYLLLSLPQEGRIGQIHSRCSKIP